MSISIKAYENGPLVISGKLRYSGGAAGEEEAPGTAVALCRCGKSGRALFCDGTHRSAGYRAREFDLVVDPPPPAPEAGS